MAEDSDQDPTNILASLSGGDRRSTGRSDEVVAQMLPRLELSPAERRQALDILLGYLDDESKIVKTFAMQGLADLAWQDPQLRTEVLPVLVKLTASGSPAMRSRGRKLLMQLGTEV